MNTIRKSISTAIGFTALLAASIVIYISIIEERIQREVETGVKFHTNEKLTDWLFEFYETIPSATHLIATGDTRFADANDLHEPMAKSGPLQFKLLNANADITYRSLTSTVDPAADLAAQQTAADVIKSGVPKLELLHDDTHHWEPGGHADDETEIHAVADAFIPVRSETGQLIGVLNAKLDVSHVQQSLETAFHDVSGLVVVGTLCMLLIPTLAVALRTVQVMQSDKKLLELAKYDQTTGVYNRATALSVLAKAFPQPPARHDYGILFVDVDYFKSVNDSFGHHSGDLVLKHIASVLERCIRQDTDTVARYGGDEFLVICPDIDMPQLRTIYQRIETAIREPVALAGKHYTASLSIGAYVSTAADSKQSALHKADLAVYAAKHAGRGRTVEYSSDLDEHVPDEGNLDQHDDSRTPARPDPRAAHG